MKIFANKYPNFSWTQCVYQQLVISRGLLQIQKKNTAKFRWRLKLHHSSLHAVSNEFLAAAHSKWMFHEYKNYLNCPLSLFFWNGRHETKIKRLFIWFWLVTRTQLIGSGQDSSETFEHETQTGYFNIVYLPPMNAAKTAAGANILSDYQRRYFCKCANTSC